MARVVLGVSQEELARSLGVSQSTLCGWETGRQPPRERLEALATALGMPRGELELSVGYMPSWLVELAREAPERVSPALERLRGELEGAAGGPEEEDPVW